jgi:hypothetical protein
MEDPLQAHEHWGEGSNSTASLMFILACWHVVYAYAWSLFPLLGGARYWWGVCSAHPAPW